MTRLRLEPCCRGFALSRQTTEVIGVKRCKDTGFISMETVRPLDFRVVHCIYVTLRLTRVSTHSNCTVLDSIPLWCLGPKIASYNPVSIIISALSAI
jgi:hypothetical protein